jgi:hypothetical protein
VDDLRSRLHGMRAVVARRVRCQSAVGGLRIATTTGNSCAPAHGCAVDRRCPSAHLTGASRWRGSPRLSSPQWFAEPHG